MSSADEEKANKASLLRLSSMFSNFVGSGSTIFPFSDGVEISKIFIVFCSRPWTGFFPRAGNKGKRAAYLGKSEKH